MDNEEMSDRVFCQTFARQDPGGRRYRNRQVLGWLCVWVLLTLVFDCLQLLAFDCSEMPVISLLLGLPTFGAAVALPMLLVENWRHDSRPLAMKLFLSVLEIVALSTIACLAGIMMLFTHMAR
jgi:hypothetical protein